MGIDGLGHDVDGGIVGRGRAEGAIRRKDSASQSMTAAAVGEVDEFRGTVEYSEWWFIKVKGDHTFTSLGRIPGTKK